MRPIFNENRNVSPKNKKTNKQTNIVDTGTCTQSKLQSLLAHKLSTRYLWILKMDFSPFNLH